MPAYPPLLTDICLNPSPLGSQQSGSLISPTAASFSAHGRRGTSTPCGTLRITPSTTGNVTLRDEHVQDRLEEMAPQIVQAYEDLLKDHYLNPETSHLRRLVPTVKRFFTHLPFAAAFDIYNQKYRVTKRRFVAPTYHEIRHIMNIAQVMAVKNTLRLITFDGDETLYPDGRNFTDLHTAEYITTVLRRGIYVAVVTAAGYAYQAEKYEARLQGLLQYWRGRNEAPEVVERFFLFGGESNYLLQCRGDFHLHPVPEKLWRQHLSPDMQLYFQQLDENEKDSDVRRLLDTAENAFREARDELHLRCKVIRKARAVGIVPGGEEGRSLFPIGSGMSILRPEILDEVCFLVQNAITAAEPKINVPFCAFNGGHDAWVDVGNKAEGVRALISFLNISPDGATLHIGDQFMLNGNDIAARDVSPTLWICSPAETKAVLRSLLRQMNTSRGLGNLRGVGSLRGNESDHFSQKIHDELQGSGESNSDDQDVLGSDEDEEEEENGATNAKIVALHV